MKNFLRKLVFLPVAVLLAGLAGIPAYAADDLMIKSAITEHVPEAGKALVIFVRSSFVVGAYAAPVVHLDVKKVDPKPEELPVDDKVVGIPSAYSKIAYQTAPGEHTFLSVPFGGGPALVARANLLPGKTYYALVKPNWGFAPSFTLMPLRNDPKADFRLDSPELAGWLKGTEFIEPSQFAQGWLNGNRQSVMQKKAEALAKWNALPEDEKKKFTLFETDSK